MAGNSAHGHARPELTIEDYATGVRAGETAILARALTLIESHNPKHQKSAEELLARLLPHTGNAIRVGITGVPGVGKSTFIEALGLHLIRSGQRIAVLAVDPSSAISGGSILADKTRMSQLSAEPEAYIRPSPAAGTLGGVASRTRESLLLCEAAGYQVILVETVGVGQSETMVADMTDCFVALMLPGAGDEIQGIKRGLLELVDVIGVNKADGESRLAAQRAAHQYQSAVQLLSSRSDQDANGPPQVMTCSAIQGEGVENIWQAIERHYQRLLDNRTLTKRRGQQNLRWMWSLVEQQLQHAVRKHGNVRAIRDHLERDVVAGVITPEAAVRQILEAIGITSNDQGGYLGV
jgi:LAO/AO transport system kinase